MDRKLNIAGLESTRGENIEKGTSFSVLVAFILSFLICSFASAKSSTPVVSLSATGLYFGYYTVGTTGGPENLFVTNSGSGSLSITSITLSGGNSSDFSQTNNCGRVLAAKASCLVQVYIKPSTTGTRSTTLYIADNASGSPQKVAFSGTGKAAASAAVTLSSTSLYFGSYAVGVTGGPENLFVTNSGGTAVNFTSITLAGGNAGDFSQTNNCGSTLAIKATCLVQVMFKPLAAGTRTTTLNIADNATGSPQMVAFSGTATGTTYSATLSTSSLSFPNQAVGTTSSAQVATLTNTGTAALAITGVTLSGTNATDFSQANNCTSSLAAGASCTFSLNFKPTAAGTRSALVSIADNATGSPQTLVLSGTGTASGASVAPLSLSFGNQPLKTASTAKTVILTNTGNAPLAVSSISLSGVNASDFAQTNNCGASVAAGATCTISVAFTPAASGNRGASVSIADNAAGSPQTISLSGTGTASTANVAPSSVAFGSQSLNAASPAQTIALTNSGNAALTVSGISFSGANASDFSQTNNCGVSVAAGAICSINIIFTPAASGTRTASLAIADSADGSPHSVSLSGAGTASAVSISPSNLALGSLPVGTTSTVQSVTLTNTGNATLSITGISLAGGNSGEFSQTNNCGSSVLAGASCSISVAFTPAAAGSRTASLAIADSATGSPQCVAVSGTGTSTSGGASLSPSNLTFANQAVEMTSNAQTISFTNTGTSTLNISAFTLNGANASDFAQNNNCGTALAVGANCTIVVLFTPSAIGARSATLSISDNAGSSPQTAALLGTGGHDVVLKWSVSPSANIIGYNIYRGTTPGGESSVPLNCAPINATAYADENVTAGMGYYYLVTSVTSDGITQSSASLETAATVPSN